MQFASLSATPHDLFNSAVSLHRHSPSTSYHDLSSVLPHHDAIDHFITTTENSRFEKKIDLVPDKDGIVSHNCSSGTCERISISVSGQLYETQIGTLNRFPNTLLGNPIKRREFWDAKRKCYVFDTHAPMFNYILYYYQSGGKLIRPEDIPEDIFLEDTAFYELGDDTIAEYKWRTGFLPEPDMILPEVMWKRKLWKLLEYPSSSTLAKVVGIISLGIILISIVNFCLESIPLFEKELCINDTDSAFTNEDGEVVMLEKQNYGSVFFVIECVCAFWFTLEVILRFIACPVKKQYLKNLMNLFDISAIVPFYVITLFVVSTGACDHSKRSSISIVFLRVLRLFRAFRIFKLTKHSRGMQILGLTIKQSLKELSLFAIFLGIAIIFFSASVYYADLWDTQSANIASIPDGFWWAIVTMCTVG